MQQTRRVTEGAILSGIFAVMLLLSLFIPFLIIILVWFLPLPFLIYTARHGLKPAFVMAIVALFLSLLLGGLIGLPNALLACAGGVTAGELIRRQKEAFLVMAGSSIAYMGMLVVLYAGFVLLLNIDPITAMQDLMRQSLQQAESMIGTLGQEVSGDLVMWEDMIDQFGYLAPLLIVFTGVIYALITQLASYPVLRRLHMKTEPFPPFREWNLPKSLLWYYLLAFAVYFIGVEEGTAMYIVLWNLLPLLETLMALQGFTVVFYYCYVKSIPKALPIIIVISGLIMPFILLIARMLGIIDLGFQLKKRLESDTK